MLFMSIAWTSASAQTCPKCQGRGQVMVDPPPVSHFGVSRKVGDCTICGHTIFQGERHRHTTCPSCNGSGKRSGHSNSRSSYDDDSAEEYDPALTPAEQLRIEELAKVLFAGKTETRTCQTCNGTGRCPGPGVHHYGNVAADVLDINSPMPSYCPLCGGMGDCPNRNCVNGTETYTRSLTDSEKEEISGQIKSIYDNAHRRENKETTYYSDENERDEYSQNEDVQNDDSWSFGTIVIAILVILIIGIFLFKK